MQRQQPEMGRGGGAVRGEAGAATKDTEGERQRWQPIRAREVTEMGVLGMRGGHFQASLCQAKVNHVRATPITTGEVRQTSDRADVNGLCSGQDDGTIPRPKYSPSASMLCRARASSFLLLPSPSPSPSPSFKLWMEECVN
jgi:hypothetical protein